MEIFVGYFDMEIKDKKTSNEPFFVHGVGRYRLLSQMKLLTERANGSPNYQLIYIAKGHAHFVMNGEDIKLPHGTIVLYPPQTPQYYYYLLEENPLIYWVHFSVGDNIEYIHKTLGQGTVVKSVGDASEYSALFEEMIIALQQQPMFFVDELKLTVARLLLKLGRYNNAYNSSATLYMKEIDEAIRNIHEKPEVPFIVKEFADRKGINYYRFIDQFTKRTKLPPKQYMIHIRMTLAKEMLNNLTLNITDIAHLLGYDNPLYFSRLFKKHWGISPLHYRKKLI